MSTSPRQRLWVVTDPYYPEQISTGYFLTGIAQCLAGIRDVGVVCSMRVGSDARGSLERRQSIRGVDVHRAGPRVGYPRSLPARAVVEGWMALALFWRALRVVRRGDEVLVVTHPPFLPFLVRLAAWLRGAEFDLLVYDMYPEVLAVIGVVREGGVVYRLLDHLATRLLESCRRIIVLSEGMHDLVSAKIQRREVPIHVVPNWGDVERVRPQPRQDNQFLHELGIADKFVVQYSGNIGRTHGVETLVDVAARMRETCDEVFFLVVGGGAMREPLERLAREHRLDNLRILDRQPQEKFTDSINACDLALIMLQKGMAGISVPSRLYNLLAAGRPLLVIADPDTEPARVVERDALGWVVPPGDVRAACEAIEEARGSPSTLAEMSARGRDIAERRHAYTRTCERFRELYR